MRGTKKITSNKSKKTLKRRTVKPKIFIRRFGDFVLCYRVNNSKPICLRKQYNSIHRNRIRGGANPIDNDTMKIIISRLTDDMIKYILDPKNEENIKDDIESMLNITASDDFYNKLKTDNIIEKNKSKILENILENYKTYVKSPETAMPEDNYNKLFTSITTEINNSVPADKISIQQQEELHPDIGVNLLKIILNRVWGVYVIEVVKSILKTQVDQKIISKDIEAKILKALDDTHVSMMGKASAITDKAFAGISTGALKLAQWISPAVTDAPNYNETAVQLLWYPRKHLQYAKGQAIPSDKIKYGDMVVKIQDKYANLSQYFSKSVNGVDDLLAHMANGCKDATCKTGDTHPKPFKIKTLTTKENFSKSGTAPEIEIKTT